MSIFTLVRDLDDVQCNIAIRTDEVIGKAAQSLPQKPKELATRHKHRRFIREQYKFNCFTGQRLEKNGQLIQKLVTGSTSKQVRLTPLLHGPWPMPFFN